MTNPEDIKWEYFKVDKEEYNVDRHSLTVVKFSGKIEKGGFHGYPLFIKITKPDGDYDDSRSGLPDSGEFEVIYGVNIDSPLGEYTAVGRYLAYTRHEKRSEPVSFKVSKKD